METKAKRVLPILLLLSLATPRANGQLSVGVDILSRYVWRGVDYGNSPSFQPSLSLSLGNFRVGTWGAYSFAGTGTPFAEHDLWASFDLPTGVGTFSALYTDYYYPSAGLKYFNFDGNRNGAHTLELGISYAGMESFPILLKAVVNVHNDPEYSTYLEIGYPVELQGARVLFFVGGTTKECLWYGTSGAAVINVGLTASKSVPVTESFSLPVQASFIVNPDLEQSHLVVGVSF